MLTYTAAFSSFSVNDIEAAKKFYGETLGITVATKPEGLELQLMDRTQVFIYEKSNHQPATYTIINFVVEDIEQAVDELTAAGVAFEHYDEPMLKTDAKGIARGGPEDMGPSGIAWFKDPAGNFLSVLQQ